MDFLGHLVSSQGIRPLAAKVEALRGHPQPNTIKELQQSLGLLNFYRRFLPSTAKVLAPLTEALRGSPAGPARILWSATMLTDWILVLPGQLPGVPEPLPVVFHESTRAAPSHIPARGTSTPKESREVPPQLQGSSFVYVRCGGAKTPLTPAYSGPFTVVSRSRKFFIQDLVECHELVSVDRLKPNTGPSIFTSTVSPRWSPSSVGGSSSTASLGGGGG